MILKALYDYYHRSGDDVAPFGLEYKEIGFIIVIDRCGKFLRFEDTVSYTHLTLPTILLV